MDLLRPALWIVFLHLFTLDVNRPVSGARMLYSRNKLLQLNLMRPAGMSDNALQLPNLILRNSNRTFGERREKKRRKRGKRGGVRLRLRKQQLNRTPLLLILGNTHSRLLHPGVYGKVGHDQDTDLLIEGFEAPHHLNRR